MQTLTKREKLLLYILLCVVIFTGGIFLLNLPAYDRYSELNAEYDTLQNQLTLEKGNVVDYGDVDKQIEEMTKKYNAMIENFYTTAMLNEDVDNLITDMAVNHGLIPLSLTIGELDDEEVKDYKTYMADLAKNNEAETKKDSQLMMKVYNVSLKVSGSISNLQAMVDDANKSKSLKIATVSYSNQSEDTKEMTVTFKIFLI